MQLKHRKMKKYKTRTSSAKITGALAGATCALLGSPALHASDSSDMGWKVDAAYLSYSEKNRVSASEPTIKLQKTFDDDSKLNLNLVLDTLTGASPNGAAPSSSAQTFTSPSGQGQYTAMPGKLPLDDTFHDTRAQFGAAWDAPINREWRYNIGFNVSAEHDYSSIGFNGGFSYAFNKKNSTLSLGLSFDDDSIKPEGGVPKPLSNMKYVGNPATRSGSNDTKQVGDILIGWNQVINASTIMQFNLGLSKSSGYLNDPYKVVTIVDPITGEPVADGTFDTDGTTMDAIVYENRPDTRFKKSIFWETKHHTFWGDTIDASYRYMTDDWGIKSHTIDFKYRWNFTDNMYLQPDMRWYTQTAADFYHHNLTAAPLPGQYMSADYRLSKFDATTFGIKYGYIFSNDSEINIRVENYKQKGTVSSTDIVGAQKRYDTGTDLNAMVFQIGYSFSF